MARKTNVQYISFYTDGSAARKVEPVAPLKTMKLPKIKIQKRATIVIDPMAVAGIAMAVMMAVLMVIGVAKLTAVRQDMAVMSQYVDSLREDNVRLEQEFAEGYDIDEIERTAKALGMIPMEQAEHVTLRLPELQEVEEPSVWERFTTFLTGLFA